MKWILMLYVAYADGGGPAFVEFDSQQACERAIISWTSVVKDAGNSSWSNDGARYLEPIIAICVPKGGIE